MNSNKHQGRYWRHFFSTPFIYGVFFPVVLLDIFLELYHRVCFPLYGLPIVPRNEYIRIDRHKLSYLGWKEKLQCIYCGYMNGFFAYAVKVAGETERYWGGIQHEKIPGFHPPQHHEDFPVFGDEDAYREKYFEKRR